MVNEVAGAAADDLLAIRKVPGAALRVLALERGATKYAARQYLLNLNKPQGRQ